MFIFGMQLYVQHGEVKFVYQGQSVEVTVTGADKRICVSCSWVVCLQLKGSFAYLLFILSGDHKSVLQCCRNYDVFLSVTCDPLT